MSQISVKNQNSTNANESKILCCTIVYYITNFVTPKLAMKNKISNYNL